MTTHLNGRKELDMISMKIYYGATYEDHHMRTIFATITGQMADGTMVYTEIEQTDEGAIVTENGEPKLILDKQYTRHLKYGSQTFCRI